MSVCQQKNQWSCSHHIEETVRHVYRGLAYASTCKLWRKTWDENATFSPEEDFTTGKIPFFAFLSARFLSVPRKTYLRLDDGEPHTASNRRNLSIDDNFSCFLSRTNYILLSFFKKVNLVKMKFTAAATALFLASASAFAPRNAAVTKAPSTAMNA